MRLDGRFRTGLATSLVLTVLLATACVTPVNGGSSTRISISTDDGRTHVEVGHGSNSLELKLRGEVRLNDDDSRVIYIEPGGSFLLVERDGLRVRKVRIEADRDGRLTYSGNAADTDDEARAWVAERLPELVEQSGLWAKERAQRMLEREGPDAVLSAVERLSHDHTRAVYLGVLLDEADLSEPDFERMQRIVATEIESDYHAAQVIGGMLEHRIGRGVTGEGLFRAIDSIESAYHRAQLLAPLADRAEELDLAAYLAAVRGVDSDYHRQEVLGRLLDRADLDDASMVEVLAQVRRVNSDYHSAELLQRLTRRLPQGPEVRKAYFDAVRDIESDYHRQELLHTLVQKHDDPAALRFVVDAARDIDSDYHKGQVLSSIARAAKRDEELLLQVIDAAAGLGSDHHLSQVVDAILDQGRLSDTVLRSLLSTVKQHMSSSHQRGRFLDRITDRMTI